MYFKKRNMKKYKSIDLYNRPVKTIFNILKWLFLFIVMTVLVMYVGFKNYANDYEILDLLIYTSIISIALFIVSLVIIKYLNRDKRKIEKKLKRFIKINNLHDVEMVETDVDKNGKPIRKRMVTYSVKLCYKIKGHKVYIKCIKDGSIKATKLETMENELIALVGHDLVDITTKNDSVIYEFRTTPEYRINVKEQQIERSKSNQDKEGYIPLNSTTSWNYAKQPHALVAGQTGGGKTYFLHYLITKFLQDYSDVYICDAKMSDLYALHRVMPEGHVASTENQIAKVLRMAREKMDARYEKYIAGDNYKSGYDYIDHGLGAVVVFFDEIGAFKAIASDKVAQEVQDNMKAIILKGRQMGVFMVLSTQQPNTDNIPSEIRDNLSLKVTLGNMSTAGYKMIFDDDYELNSVSGVGTGYYFLNGLGWERPRPYQAPFIDMLNIDFVQWIANFTENVTPKSS